MRGLLRGLFCFGVWLLLTGLVGTAMAIPLLSLLLPPER